MALFLAMSTFNMCQGSYESVSSPECEWQFAARGPEIKAYTVIVVDERAVLSEGLHCLA